MVYVCFRNSEMWYTTSWIGGGNLLLMWRPLLHSWIKNISPKNIQQRQLVSVYSHGFPACWPKNLAVKNCCNFPRNHFFPLSPHLASIHLSSGSTACESDILFILFSLPLFLLKLSFRFLCWFTFSIVLSSNKTRREFEMESKEMIELRWICVLFSNVQPYRALPPAHHPGIIVLSEKNQQRNWKQSFATIHLSASLFPSGTKMVGEENISSFERKSRKTWKNTKVGEKKKEERWECI